MTSRVVNMSQLSGLSADCISGIAPVLTTDKKRIGFQGNIVYSILYRGLGRLRTHGELSPVRINFLLHFSYWLQDREKIVFGILQP